MISNPQASLLEKLHLTLDQLDYKYIENCKNVKQLERILRVLRSGEEGVYPDLIKFCEARLEEVDPSNKYLLSAKGIVNYSDLPEEEKENILSDLETWSKEFSKRIHQNTPGNIYDIPPVRGQKITDTQSQNNSDNGNQKNNETKHKNIKPRSYEEWDKFDVEGELKKLENKDETEKLEEKMEEKVCLDNFIPVTGLSAVEREHIANLERIKGNEAFKAQDYEEAVLYYSRSLSASKTAKTLNNRAQAHLKLKNYLEAVIDCNEVISMEPNNIKALFRRGIAHKEAQMFDLATIDFEIILRMDPENKPAKDQLMLIENSLVQKPKDKRKVVIEELESVIEDNNETDESPPIDIQSVENSKRLEIEEIIENPQQVLDELCNCHINDDDIRPLSKNTREMLNIFKSNSTTNVKSEQVIVEETHNQLHQGNSKSINLNDVNISKPFGKTIPKADFKEVEIPNNITEKSKIIKQNNLETVQKDEHLNSSIKIEEMCAQLKKDSKCENTNEKMQENIQNQTLDSGKEISAQVKEQKSITTKSIIMHSVTPFEFLQVWLSNNCNSNSDNGAACLLAVNPQKLPNILTNKLDGPLLSSLLMAIKNVFNTGKLKESLQYLKCLLEVPRIELTALFLSTNEKKDIEDLLSIMEKQLGGNLDYARKILSIN